ncbi:hypothetical protein B0H16DRAFT_1716092 [Mycena metata]|uniref:Uncharacterized protein n=1 Tax=Mycena metata TaxID=1033252 RepID=A0AAD7JP18_9AGAR|nr:hypothetical protein B0H16DRAFT_1716092 [Mycena metata]
MPGYEKPRLRQFSSRSGVHAIIILRLFGTLLMSTVLGFSLNLIYLATHPLDSLYFSVYSTGLFAFWGLVLGQLLVPAAIKISDILDIQPKRFHRSHAESAKSDSGAKKLRAKLKASEELARKQGLEIQSLRSQLNVGLAFNAQAQPPSTPRAGVPSLHHGSPVAGPSRLPVPSSPIDVDTPSPDMSPIAGPSRLPALNLFPGLVPLDIPEVRSDFDYTVALQSDNMDRVFKELAECPTPHLKSCLRSRVVYAVNGDDEVLASDPFLYTP